MAPRTGAAQANQPNEPATNVRRVVRVGTIAAESNAENVEEALVVIRQTFVADGVELIEVGENQCLAEDESACLPLLEEHDADALLIVSAYPASGELRPAPVLVLDLLSGDAHVSRSRTFASMPTAVAAPLLRQCLAAWGGAQPVEWTIVGTPEGAAVQIDQEMGALPFTTRLEAGEHRLVVRAPGHITHRETVTLEAGQGALRTEVALEAGEDASDAAETPRRASSGTPWQRIAGPVLMGVGAAGAAASVIAALVDSGEVPDGERSIAVGPFLGYLGASLAVAGVGLALWLTAPDAATQVSVGPGSVNLHHPF